MGNEQKKQKVVLVCDNDEVRITLADLLKTEVGEEIKLIGARDAIDTVNIIKEREGGVDSLLIVGRLYKINEAVNTITKPEVVSRLETLANPDVFYPDYGPADIVDCINVLCREHQVPSPRIYFAVYHEDFSEEQINAAKSRLIRVVNVNEDKEPFKKLEAWIRSWNPQEKGEGVR